MVDRPRKRRVKKSDEDKSEFLQRFGETAMRAMYLISRRSYNILVKTEFIVKRIK